MAKSIYERLEATFKRVKANGGDVMCFCNDGVSEHAMMSLMAMTPESATWMFVELFNRFPFLIPKALYAASMVMDDDDCDSDDDPDDDDGPSEDGVPIGGGGVGCEVCMN